MLSTSLSGGSSSGLTTLLRGSVSHAASTSASSSSRIAMSWKRVIYLFLSSLREARVGSITTSRLSSRFVVRIQAPASG